MRSKELSLLVASVTHLVEQGLTQDIFHLSIASSAGLHIGARMALSERLRGRLRDLQGLHASLISHAVDSRFLAHSSPSPQLHTGTTIDTLPAGLLRYAHKPRSSQGVRSLNTAPRLLIDWNEHSCLLLPRPDLNTLGGSSVLRPILFDPAAAFAWHVLASCQK